MPISSTVSITYPNNVVTVTAQDIDMPVTSQGAQVITFSLSVAPDVPGGPYEFPDDGDTTYPNNGISITSGAGEFDSYNKQGNGDVKVRDLNNNTTSYEYSVTVLDASGNPHVSDPSIRNGGTN